MMLYDEVLLHRMLISVGSVRFVLVGPHLGARGVIIYAVLFSGCCYLAVCTCFGGTASRCVASAWCCDHAVLLWVLLLLAVHICPGGTASRCVASAWCCADAVLLLRVLLLWPCTFVLVGPHFGAWEASIAMLCCSGCCSPHLPHPSQPHLPHPSQLHLAGTLPSCPRRQLGRRAVCKH